MRKLFFTRKLFITIVLAGVALGSLGRPVFAQTLSKDEKRRLILKGSKLWPVYCNQCHNARPPGEKAPYEWDQEIMHMRMLGNIPADDARALVEYLKTR
jgi:hypothetical protein